MYRHTTTGDVYKRQRPRSPDVSRRLHQNAGAGQDIVQNDAIHLCRHAPCLPGLALMLQCAPMKFSLRLNNDLPISNYVILAREAERVGFDQLWVSDDLFLRGVWPCLLYTSRCV